MQNEQPPLGIGRISKNRLKIFLIFNLTEQRLSSKFQRQYFFKNFFKKVLTFFRKRDTLCLALGDQEC